MSKISQKKNEKYTNILSAAYTLYEKKDPISISVDEIVRSAGVAKGTFYLYFKDKYEVVSRLIIQSVDEYMQSLGSELSAEYVDLNARIRKYIDAFAEFLENNITLTRLIDKNVHLCVNTVIENRTGNLKTIFDSFSEKYESLGFSEKEAEIKLYLRLELLVSACCNAILRGVPYTLDEILPHLYETKELALWEK